jgi:outer membrane protein
MLGVGCLSVSVGAAAEMSIWSLGVGAIYSPAVYEGTPTNRVVIPVIGYEGEHLFLRGFSAGYRLNPARSTHNLVFRLQYDPRSLNASHSNNADIQKLDDRDSTILGGASYQYLAPIGLFSTTLATDIGDTHNGLYGEVAWRLPIRTKRWGITPAIGYTYNSERLNQHLYGVSESESAATGGNIAPFDASWDGQYFLGLSAYAMLSSNIRLSAGVRYTNLEGDLEDSPILDKTISTVANIGLTYSF